MPPREFIAALGALWRRARTAGYTHYIAACEAVIIGGAFLTLGALAGMLVLIWGERP